MTNGAEQVDQVPDWQLERHLLDELPRAEAEAVRDAALREDVRARLCAIERSTEHTLRQHPPADVAASIRVRLAATTERDVRRPTRHRRLLALAVTAAAIAGVAVVAPRDSTPPEIADITRAKGGTSGLLVYRNAGGAGAERLRSGSVARHQDLVQLAYQVAGRRHGVIVSVDGAGVVTRHLPATGTSSVLLEAGAQVPLPDAYQLDDSPGYERFILVTSDQPFAVAVVIEAARAATGGLDGRLALRAGMEQSSFVLRKESVK